VHEAETAFADEHGLLMADPDHSEDEDRFILLGSATLRLLVVLVVCHTYREEDEVIRLISAHKAALSERAQYSKRWRP
jgi:uncharacterized DUF497 family protein